MTGVPRKIGNQPGPVRICLGVPRGVHQSGARPAVAEAFRCCQDVTPSIRESAPDTQPQPSGTPAPKPQHDIAERHPIPGPTFHDHGRPPHTGQTNKRSLEQGSQRDEELKGPYRAKTKPLLHFISTSIAAY